MPARNSDVRRHVSRVAIMTRHRGADSPEVTEARRDLRAQQLADHIEQVVSQAPPLSAEQRDRLALLLRGASPAARSTSDLTKRSAA